MTESPQLRAEVRDILLAFDRGFTPGGPHAADVLRHAYRLRFALARYEEMAHAGVMQSALYTEARLDVAASILRLDIDRARAFLASLQTERATAPTASVAEDDEHPELQEAA
jgi:hypothetical protein